MRIYVKKVLHYISKNGETSLEEFHSAIGESNEQLTEALNFLSNRGVIKLTDTHIKLGLSPDQRVGTFKGNSKGFGFLITFTSEKDFYVFNKNVKGALDGDLVVGRIMRESGSNRSAEVKIEDILLNGQEKYLGTFYDNGENGFVQLNNKSISDYIFISKKKRGEAEEGNKVFVTIDMRGTKNKRPSGTVVDVLGSEDDVGYDVLALVRERDIDVDFSEETMQEVQSIPEVVLEEELEGREDFRNELIFTIDGDDTKDFDDAVGIKKLDNGMFELSVHIADVAHYVQEGTALDEDALSRATSVYLVDRVIPMLPSKLSNGICSLNPYVDRLTLSCVMVIDRAGTVVESRVVNGVINSKERLTYNEVAAMLEDQDQELIEKYAHCYPTLVVMEELAKILMKKRYNRGSIDFDFPEAKVKLDENGKPYDIIKRERNMATKLIEEFMIVTNEAVSEKFTMLELPFVYRIHESPDPEKFASFNAFIELFGFGMDGASISPKSYQDLLEEVAESPASFPIRQVMLRSLKKAFYSHENKGHFGLASKYYSHFTSPIRRYPDLQIHRIIKEYLEKGHMRDERKERLREVVIESSEQSSRKEVRAQMAERDSVQMKKAEYMLDKIGEVFEGIVSGVSEYGIYVTLENTIEGMVHVTKMPNDYWIFEEETFSMYGEKTGDRISLGDKLTVSLATVNVQKRQIDFVIVPKTQEDEVDSEEVEHNAEIKN